ncbi:MAG TPA: GNAT family N-acetyltransferase [Gemmatimonadales bacterium]|nr:GNAT family N-acetyltransferase [Gemmatimonadales bacterium]
MPTVDVTRTYLEMTSPADLAGAGAVPPAGARVERVRACSPGFFRFLYGEVGGPYHWRDRLPWSDERIHQYLEGPVDLWVLYEDGAPAGYFELLRHPDGSVEIAYFGLMPHAIGRGLGGFLLTRAVQEAWALGPARVWLHTCTLDHPAALPNYLSRGFRRVREEVYQTTIP